MGCSTSKPGQCYMGIHSCAACLPTAPLDSLDILKALTVCEAALYLWYILCSRLLQNTYAAAVKADKPQVRGVSQREGETGPGAIPRIKLVLLGDSVGSWLTSLSRGFLI